MRWHRERGCATAFHENLEPANLQEIPGSFVGENDFPWPYVSLAFRQANSKADEPPKLNFFRLTYHFPPFLGALKYRVVVR